MEQRKIRQNPNQESEWSSSARYAAQLTYSSLQVCLSSGLFGTADAAATEEPQFWKMENWLESSEKSTQGREQTKIRVTASDPFGSSILWSHVFVSDPLRFVPCDASVRQLGCQGKPCCCFRKCFLEESRARVRQ